MQRRFILQRALTNEFLHMDAPVTVSEISWARNAAGALRGELEITKTGDIASDGKPFVLEWSTLVFEETNGAITWGGIVTKVDATDTKLSFEAASFVTYPVGIPFGGVYSGTDVDVVELYKMIWTHVQGQTDGSLGVTVTGGNCGVTLGTSAVGTSGQSGYVAAAPYALNWWDAPDCGSKLAELVTTGDLIVTEQHAWTEADTISHTLTIAAGRVGRQRDDLVFRSGENVTAIGSTTGSDDYANAILALGAGEGALAVRSSAVNRDGRLRRVAVLSSKSITHAAVLGTLANANLTRRQQPFQISSITVKDHPHAPIGSWNLDDDLRVDVEIRGYGEVSIWGRVTGWSRKSDSEATIALEQAEISNNFDN